MARTTFISKQNLLLDESPLAVVTSVAYSGTTATGSAVANVQDEHLSDSFLSDVGDPGAAATEQIDVVFDDQQTVSLVSLHGHNDHETWRVKLYSDAAFSTLILDTGDIDAPGYVFARYDRDASALDEWSGATAEAAVVPKQCVLLIVGSDGQPKPLTTVRAVRIEFKGDVGNTSYGYEAGYINISDVYVPTKNPSIDVDRGWEERADIIEGTNGFVSGIDRGVARTQKFTFHSLPDNELNEELEALQVRCQTFRPFVLGLDFGRIDEAHFDVRLYRLTRMFSVKPRRTREWLGRRHWTVGPISVEEWTA